MNVHGHQMKTLWGESRTLFQWTERFGVPIETVYRRMERYGWSAEDALTTSPYTDDAVRARERYEGIRK